MGSGTSKRDLIKWAMGRTAMATACRLNGMHIFVNADDHPPPHFHVGRGTPYTSGYKESLYRIDTLEEMEGNLNSNDAKAVKNWARSRQKELMEFWDLAIQHVIPPEIP